MKLKSFHREIAVSYRSLGKIVSVSGDEWLWYTSHMEVVLFK